MSTKFYFHSVEISNFRAFKKLKVDKLKRLNLIGGFNGVGKTAFLETLFFYLDRKLPIALLKPMGWRRLEMFGPLDVGQFLYDRSIPSAEIACKNRNGMDELVLTNELPPPNIALTIPTSEIPAGVGTMASNRKGMSIKLFKSGTVSEESYLIPAENGAIGHVAKASDSTVPSGTILSISNRAGPQEVAQRLSALIKSRRTPALITALRQLVPELQGLQTLQEGGVPQIYAEVGNEFLPVQMLGDGFQNLLHTLLGIMNSRDGVLLLDEIDAALHYSKISTIWTIIARMADEENCQVFATTHSRECINSAADGIRSAGRGADFQYLRLERAADGEHRAISYTIDEVKDAELSDVEIR